ncbi:hypothetical protein GGR56DRAFT_483397 [Xylariaceae sp. FL0804]|nr:hypothetical protein GGR56DRAFT_483397 [Xylariaceae sp. FL0804]
MHFRPLRTPCTAFHDNFRPPPTTLRLTPDRSIAMSGLDPVILAVFGPPPEGLDVYASTQVQNYIITAVGLFLAFVFTLARWVARVISGAGLQLDDYVLFANFPLVVLTAVFSILSGQSGAGTHVYAFTQSNIGRGLKLAYVYSFVWGVTVCVTKLAVIFLYRRIFGERNKAFKIWLYVMTVLCVGLTIAVIITNATICVPLSFFWSQFEPDAEGKCGDDGLFLLVSGVINVAIDVALVVTPIPMILALKMSVKKKASVCGIMLLGVLVCIAGIVRIAYLVKYWQSLDKTWWAGYISTWSSIEVSFGIVSACLPVMRPIYSRVRHGKNGTRSGQTYPSQRYASMGESGHAKSAARRSKNYHYLDDEIGLATATVTASPAASTRGSPPLYGHEITVNTEVNQYWQKSV